MFRFLLLLLFKGFETIIKLYLKKELLNYIERTKHKFQVQSMFALLAGEIKKSNNININRNIRQLPKHK